MIELRRDTLNTMQESAKREWLVTNGIGGYAGGTVAGPLSRRYHGLLVAALQPPLGRTVLVSKTDERFIYNDTPVDLASNQWASDPAAAVEHGYQHLDRFALEDGMPSWTYTAADAALQKTVWMEYGQNTTYIRYAHLRGGSPIRLTIKILLNHTDFHAVVRGAGHDFLRIHEADNRLTIQPAWRDHTTTITLVGGGTLRGQYEWYRDYFLAIEAERGFDPRADHLFGGMAEVELMPGASVALVCSTESAPPLDYEDSADRFRARGRALIAESGLADSPAWVQSLVLAADQCIVARPTPAEPDGRTVIAGYHWFGDWGRDTMISLPGLALTTRRFADAASILRTFARYVDQGMLPNRFPDAGETPEYNTVDASLWYFEAIRQYAAATDDRALVAALFPTLREMIGWHERGTRYHIQVDPADGLLYSGEAGVQLTWMDAKVGEWVITPRTGKAVEINALWYNALRSMAWFATLIGADGAPYEAAAVRVRASFARFWNEAAGYCYDVIDTPNGDDASLRPNQLFAVSLLHSPLTPEQGRAVLDACARHLLTPHGLRSLAPSHAAYQGRYQGDGTTRDSRYHQGTVWAWLIGAFIEAHLRVDGDAAAARALLEPFQALISYACMGTVAEIFDGDAPYAPRGAAAQAWSVAEALRAWTLIEHAPPQRV